MIGLAKGIPSFFMQNLIGTITNFAIDDNKKGHIIPFVFSPSGLSDSVTANISQTSIPGASAPQITYSNTGARQVSLVLELPLDYLPPNSSFTNFEDYLNAFRALVYPRYTNEGKVESPRCKLETSNVELDGICTNCGIEYKTDRYANDGSMSAQISLTFIEVLDNVKDVDATWIANSKVNMLNSTVVTTLPVDGPSRTIDTSSRGIDDTRCRITVLGSSTYDITSTIPSLNTLIKEGVYVDPGCTYTRQDKYAIRTLWGFVRNVGRPTKVENLQVSINNGIINAVATVGGSTVNLGTQCPNAWGQPGDTISYFVVYIPIYDVDKFEVGSAKERFIYINVVSGGGN